MILILILIIEIALAMPAHIKQYLILRLYYLNTGKNI